MTDRKLQSPSSIGTFISCPYAYYLKYIRGIKFEDDETNAAGTGKSIHTVLEKYWGERQTIADPNNALQSSITKHWKGKADADAAAIAETCFTNFIANLSSRTPAPLFIEERIENPEAGTLCIIDRVDEDRIVDYKTGAYFTVTPKTPAIIQATLCYENLKYKHGLDIPTVEFHYLRNMTKPGKGIQTVKVTPEIIEQVHRLIAKINEMIDQGNFPKRDSCFMCLYSKICETEKRMLKEKEKHYQRMLI